MMKRERQQQLGLLALGFSAGIVVTTLYSILVTPSLMLSTEECVDACMEVIRDMRDQQFQDERDSIVWHQAKQWGVPPQLAIAVSRVENWSGDSTAVSSAGAVGIMQIMPFWGPGGEYDISGLCIDRSGPPWGWPVSDTRDLTNRTLNACLGSLILRMYWEKHDYNWNKALRAYNGALHLPRVGDRYVSLVVSKLDFGG